MENPKLDWKQMPIPVFFNHCLLHNFWVHLKSGLVFFFNDGGFISDDYSKSMMDGQPIDKTLPMCSASTASM